MVNINSLLPKVVKTTKKTNSAYYIDSRYVLKDIRENHLKITNSFDLI